LDKSRGNVLDLNKLTNPETHRVFACLYSELAAILYAVGKTEEADGFLVLAQEAYALAEIEVLLHILEMRLEELRLLGLDHGAGRFETVLAHVGARTLLKTEEPESK
jgi:hypothetical protein